VDFQLAQAQLALAANELGSAMAAVEAAISAAPRDPRAVLLSSEMALRQNQRDRAIEILQDGLRALPRDVELNRKLVALLAQSDKWQAIDGALAGLRVALNEAGLPVTEANLVSAHIFEKRGQFYRAVTEYQAALAQRPDDIVIQLGLARAAEQSGRVTTAISAYSAVLQRAPDNIEARTALARIQRDKKLLEVFGGPAPQTGVKEPR
jgi:predicted Zn-dependent protease